MTGRTPSPIDHFLVAGVVGCGVCQIVITLGVPVRFAALVGLVGFGIRFVWPGLRRRG